MIEDHRILIIGISYIYLSTARVAPVHAGQPAIAALSCDAVRVAAGSEHSYALMSDGSTYSWGGNTRAQLATRLYSIWHREEPLRISGLSLVSALGSGTAHGLVVDAFAGVYAWGDNNSGQVGDSPASGYRNTPIRAVSSNSCSAVAGGDRHSLALRTDGIVLSWGENGSGQLGRTLADPREAPYPGPVSGLTGVVAIAAGGNTSLALRSDGTLWGWGAFAATALRSPQRIFVGQTVLAMAAGSLHILAVRSDGTVWGVGANDAGQLGDGTTTEASNWVQSIGVTGAVAVAAGAKHSLALLADSTLRAWGRNEHGQLGTGTATDALVPAIVAGADQIATVACGAQHSLAVRTDGSLLTWGWNGSGQLGNGRLVFAPLPIKSNVATGIAQISSQGTHAVALRSDGTLLGWGANASGQLGAGSTSSQQSIPVVPVGGIDGISVAAWEGHSIVAARDGSVWAWGANAAYQLGNGSTTDADRPVPVSGLGQVTAVATGFFHGLARKSDGTVWAWGTATKGQLGGAASAPAPVQVMALSAIADVAAGYEHSVALADDGSVWTWGANNHGQLGNGTTSNNKTPNKVAGLSEVIAIAAGYAHTLAVSKDGTVWGWGGNFATQLGDGTTTSRLTPIQIPGLAGIVDVAASSWAHSVALSGDGSVWAWGYNLSGQLGTGSSAGYLQAVRVPGIGDAVAIGVGLESSYAITRSGDLFAWGWNGWAQLGTGVDPRSAIPEVINVDFVPPDQRNRLMAVRSSNRADLFLSWIGAPASRWRLFRDGSKTSIGLTPMMPDAELPWLTDAGMGGPTGDLYYYLRGVSPCGDLTGP